MERWHKIENIAGAVIFGLIGMTALIAAVFFGKTHQLAVAVICLLLTWAFIAEIVQEERKAKISNRQNTNNYKLQL